MLFKIGLCRHNGYLRLYRIKLSSIIADKVTSSSQANGAFMGKSLVLYQPKIMTVENSDEMIRALQADQFSEIQALTPDINWDFLSQQLGIPFYQATQQINDTREFFRIDLNKSVQLFDIHGQPLGDGQIQDFSPKGIQCFSVDAIYQQPLVLFSNPLFRAVGQVKHVHQGSQQYINGCEFMAMRFLLQRYFIDTQA